MGCCTSNVLEESRPTRQGFDDPLGYFIHADPALEDAVCTVSVANSPRSGARVSSGSERPVVRASRQRRDTVHMSPSTETDFAAPTASFLSDSSGTPITQGQRKLGRSHALGSSGNSHWGSSGNLHFGSSSQDDWQGNDLAENLLAALDTELNVLRGADSVGDPAIEPSDDAREKRCRKIVKRAIDHGINEDPDQFDAFPEPLSVLATSIRRCRKWLQTIPSYPRRFAPAPGNASGSEAYHSSTSWEAQTSLPLIDPYAFSNIGSSIADRDVRPRVATVPNTPINLGAPMIVEPTNPLAANFSAACDDNCAAA